MPTAPDTQVVPGFCTLCRSRCGALYTIVDGRLAKVEPDPDHPTGGALCAKGRAAPELAMAPDRIATPLRRTRPKSSADPGWEPISWDEALDEIASRLAAIARDDGPEAVCFASTTPSGSGIADSIEWVEAFVRTFGSPNLVAAVELCNFQKDYGHSLTFGAPLGMPDYARADLIVLWGHNPARTWLAQANVIGARRPGTRLVVIDPKRAGSGQQADLWLGLRPGTDAALALGAVRHLIAEGSYDAAFVRDWTDAALLVDAETGRKLRADVIGGAPDHYVAIDADGVIRAVDTSRPPSEIGFAPVLLFDDVVELPGGRRLRCRSGLSLLADSASRWTIEAVARATGLSMVDVSAFYAMLASAGRASYFLWTGTAQGPQATQTTRAIDALFALRGDVDQPGGNRWYRGAGARRLPAPRPEVPALGVEDLPLGPPRHGYVTLADLCTAVEEGRPYPIRALFGFGTNLLASHPDAERTSAALARLDFQVHCDLFLNPTADTADIVLPVTVPWEHAALRVGFDTSERAAGHVQLRPRLIDPPGDQRPDYAIVRALAARLGFDHPSWHGPIEDAWNWMLEPVGIDVAALRAAPSGIAIDLDQPVAAYASPVAPGRVKGFATPSRRIELHSESLLAQGQPAVAGWAEPPRPDPALPIRLTTAKSGYFTHSSLRNIPSLRVRSPDPAIALSPALSKRRAIVEGDWCRVRTAAGSVRMRVEIDADLQDDVAIAEFGWWRGSDACARDDLPLWGPDSSNINAILGAGERDPVSGVPATRQTWCDIQRDDLSSLGHWAGSRMFRVTGRARQKGDVVEFTLEPVDGGVVPAFLPGQHVRVTAEAAGLSRFYSLVSPGNSVERSLRIAVRRRAGGQPGLSAHLHDAVPVGAALALEAPAGRFVLPLHTARPVVCIAGGIGITPFLSYLRAAAASPVRPPRIAVHLAARSIEEAPFHEELSALAAILPQLDYRLHLSRADPAASRTQWIDDAIRSASGESGERPLFYLCGSTGLMDAAAERLAALGAAPGDVQREIFETPTLPSGPLADATITLARSGRSFSWAASSGSILDAGLAAGIALPSGCRVGQCESCAIGLLSGATVSAVQHQLGPDNCLTCCSVPVGDVVLDA